MSKPSPLFGLALLVPTLVASCFSIPESKRFSHDFHRMKYRLADNELRGVQFYISTDVIVHTETPKTAARPARTRSSSPRALRASSRTSARTGFA